MFHDFITKYTYFLLKNERSFCTAKASDSFSTKNIGIFEILTFEIFNEALTNDVVSFEQQDPACYFLAVHCDTPETISFDNHSLQFNRMVC